MASSRTEVLRKAPAAKPAFRSLTTGNSTKNIDEDEEEEQLENQHYRLIRLRQNEANGKLGFSLRGGKEATGCSVGVFVSHVELAGQANKNGLRVGDQLVQVNGLQVSQATYDEVIELIRRTPRRDEIHLLVNYVGQIPFQEKSGEPIRWLQIDALLAPTETANASTNLKDDEEINKSQLQQNGYVETQTTKAAPRKPPASYQDDSAASSQSLTFTSSTSNSSSTSSASSLRHSDDDLEEEEEEFEDDGGACRKSNVSTTSSSGCSISMSSMQSSGGDLSIKNATNACRRQQVASEPILVRVPGGRQTSEPFGCGVVKGPDEWPGIFVQHVKPGSLAARVGLEPGDQLLEAEHNQLNAMSFEDAIKLIKQLQAHCDELQLLVRKGAALRHLAEGRACKQHQAEASGGATQTAVENASSSSKNVDAKVATSPALSEKQRRRPLPRPPGQSPPPPPLPPTGQRAAQLENSISRVGNLAQASNAPRCAPQGAQQQQARTREQTKAAAAAADLRAFKLAEPIERCKKSSTSNGQAAQQRQQPPEAIGGCQRQPNKRHDEQLELVEDADEQANELLELLPPTGRRPTATSSGQATNKQSAAVAGGGGAQLKAFEALAPRGAGERLIGSTATSTNQMAKCAPTLAATNCVAANNGNDKTLEQDEQGEEGEEEEDEINLRGDENEDVQEEQINIVRQVCKLHHRNSSLHSLSDKMSPFVQDQAAARGGRPQKVSLMQQANSNKQRQAVPPISCMTRQQSGLAAVGKARVQEATKPAAPLQRYLSMDNLAQQSSCNLAPSSSNFNKLQQARVNLHRQQPAVASQAHLQRLPQQQQQRIYRRSNSVLGQAACCSLVRRSEAPFCAQAAGGNNEEMGAIYATLAADQDLKLVQQQRRWRQQQQQQQMCTRKTLAAATTSSCRLACNCPAASNNQASGQAAAAGSMRLTMRHLQQQQQQQSNRILSAGRYRRQSNTLALSKFKARSEDKLNLMSVNLNYVQIGHLNAAAQTSLRAPNNERLHARASSQLQQAAGCYATCCAMLPGCNQTGASDLQPLCASQARHQQQRQTVFQYATTMGMISQAPSASSITGRPSAACATLKSLGSAKSCCAINRCTAAEFAPRASTNKHHLIACPSLNLSYRQELGSDLNNNNSASCACDTLSCSASFYCASEQQQLAMLRLAAGTCSGPDSKPQAARARNADARMQTGGISTDDSSGYHSSSYFEQQRRAMVAPPVLQQRDTSKQLSTFGARKPKAAAAAVEDNQIRQMQATKFKNNQSLLITQTSGSQCDGSCISSPSSASNSSGCSPASSPTVVVVPLNKRQVVATASRHCASKQPANQQLSSLSPSSNSPASSRSSSPTIRQQGKMLLIKRKAQQLTSELELIPRPPPMPIVGPDGRTLTRPPPPTASAAALPKATQQQITKPKKPLGGGQKELLVHASKSPPQRQIGNKLNRLCFVDELKMLAGRSSGLDESGREEAASSKTAPPGEPNHVDSSTLIKMINANNKAAAAASKQLNCSSCCQALGKAQAPNNACCFTTSNKLAKSHTSCGRAPQLAVEPKSVKLRDEEDNKRRQHELLMEEFKTAHSKMFNKLRQAAASEHEDQQPRPNYMEQSSDGGGDDDDNEIHGDGNSQAGLKSNNNLARASVAG